MNAVVAKAMEADALIRAGKPREAQAILQRLLAQQPTQPDLNSLMATVQVALGQFERAVFFAQRAHQALPTDVKLLVAYAQTLAGAGRVDQALDAARRALRLDPTDTNALGVLAQTATDHGRFDDALEAAHQLRRVRPDADSAVTLAAALLHSCRPDDAVDTLRHSLEHDPPAPTRRAAVMLLRGLASTLNYCGGVRPDQSRLAHSRHADALAHALGVDRRRPSRLPPPPPDRDRPLTVALLSSDLRRHSVASFAEPILEFLDREQFRLIVYENWRVPDEVTRQLRVHGRPSVVVRSMTDAELAARIRQDRVDILVELNGLTEGERIAALATRPAPLQLSYCGYPHAVGVPWIDGRIVDSRTDPPVDDPAQPDPTGPEPLLRLDPCFLCYRPPPPADAPAPEPGPIERQGGGVTFGSFNAAAKLGRETLELWAALLNAVPGARLVLKNLSFRHEGLRVAIGQRLSALGVGPERVEFLGPIPEQGGHLAAYRRMDIALDPFPYHGTTTTCEALLMGVPVVSLRGDMHHSRVAASLLAQVGLDDLVASDRAGFIAAAGSLAAAPDRLAALRRELRPRLLGSALCDAPGFARRFGDLLRRAWRADPAGS